MKRALIAIALSFYATEIATADASPLLLLGIGRRGNPCRDLPPEPKLIPVEHKITTVKEYPDYLFFTILSQGKERLLTSVNLAPDNPFLISSMNRGDNNRAAVFVAVPREMRNKYDNEDEFHAAIKVGKVKGLVRSGYSFDPLEKVISYSPPSSIVKVYVLDKIDPREGITLSEKPEAIMKPDSPAKEIKAPGEGKNPSSFVPAGRIWVAGLAGSGALVLAGMWLVGRNRQS